jgi:hypothetical protein
MHNDPSIYDSRPQSFCHNYSSSSSNLRICASSSTGISLYPLRDRNMGSTGSNEDERYSHAMLPRPIRYHGIEASVDIKSLSPLYGDIPSPGRRIVLQKIGR